MYAGGVNTQGGHSVAHSATYVYHPGSDKWTRAADMPYEVFGASYTSANGELQVTAGFTTDSVSQNEAAADTRKVVQYDPASDTWTSLAEAPQATDFSGSGTGCGLTQIGGSDPNGLAGTTGRPSGPGSRSARATT